VSLTTHTVWQGNVADVLTAFSEMGIKLEELEEHATEDQQMPFAQALPNFPIKKRRRCVEEPIGQREGLQHIPPWLPRLPQAHTWKTGPALNKSEAVAKDVGKQRVNAEASLVGLHKKVPTAFGGLHVPQAETPPPAEGSGQNAFLQPPTVVAAEDANYGEPLSSAAPMLNASREIQQGAVREATLDEKDRVEKILELPHAEGDNMLGVTKLSSAAEEY